MLHRRLTLLAVAVALATITACSEGGAIEENVVRPGITAIAEDAPEAACSANAATIRLAVDAYTTLEGEPPPDEQALVDAGFLRETTSDWDVLDGELVAENPACGTTPEAPVGTVDIVTETEPLDADRFYDAFDEATIRAMGGEACVRELAAIVAAAQTFYAERGEEPADIEALVATGYLPAMPERWALGDDELVPVDGSGCNLE